MGLVVIDCRLLWFGIKKLRMGKAMRQNRRKRKGKEGKRKRKER